MQWCLLKHNIPFFFLLWETFCPRRQFKLPLIWPYFDRNLHQGRRRVRKGQEQNQGRGHHLDPGLVQDHQSDTEKDHPRRSGRRRNAENPKASPKVQRLMPNLLITGKLHPMTWSIKGRRRKMSLWNPLELFLMRTMPKKMRKHG